MKKKRIKPKKPNFLRRGWRRIEDFFEFVGHIFEGIARKFRLSISIKITFAFVAITWFNVKILRVFGLDRSLFVFVGLPLIAIFGRRAVDYLLLPIKDMTNSAREISGSKLGRRLDVSEAQDELQDMAIIFNQMLDRIETSVEEQKAFISHASHELRTPLAVIDGYSNLLDRWGKEDPTVRDEAIEAIKNEASSMKNLIEKLLMISRMDSATKTIEPSLVDIQALIKEVVEETMLMSPESPTFIGNAEPLSLPVDRLLLKEVLRILVDNAVKYTPSDGAISLKAFDRPGWGLIIIQDTGCGVDPEHLPHLFDSFYRADDSRTRHTGGTGLGLAIAKRIINLHGGVISVDSEPGLGTRLTIELPNPK